nr:histone-lysine N-methyltransferase SETMAR-like [Parasteatoda tepidariorum]
MDTQREHYRHTLFYFRKGKNAVQARKKLCEVYDEDCLTERQCHRWFARFCAGNFNVQYASHTGRPTTTDDDKIKALIEANRRMTTREIAEKLDMTNSIV